MADIQRSVLLFTASETMWAILMAVSRLTYLTKSDVLT